MPLKTDASTTEPGDSAEPLQVAVIDDDPRILATLVAYLKPLGVVVKTFADASAFLPRLESWMPDILITDLRLPGTDGIQILETVRQRSPTTDVIILTGSSDKQDAIRALKLGAFDFFEKPVDREAMLATIKRTVRYRELVRERNRIADQLSFVSRQEARRWGIGALIGKSAVVRKVVSDIELLQRSSSTSVLIMGESGTGKELVARAIHFGSKRSMRPFVPVNCSAIPTELAESTLFGHARGSFTGATSDREGAFELAHEGTIFLDEIGDMPPMIQIKLLRVLEDGLVVPVGRTSGRKVDVRVIAATNADLPAKIAGGAFRADLFYRLAGFTFHVPPLRERQSDIPLLVEHFAGQFAAEMGLAAPEIASSALVALQEHPFPGNVRELRNMVERALIESGGRPIGIQHLHFMRMGEPVRKTTPDTPPAARTAAGTASVGGDESSIPLNLASAEQILIRRAMAQVQGNIAAASRLLGLSRAKLYRKLSAQQGGGTDSDDTHG